MTRKQNRADPYRDVLDRAREAGADPSLLRSLSELVALVELSTGLGFPGSADESLTEALRVVTRQLRASRAALLLRDDDGRLQLSASLGLDAGHDAAVALAAPPAGLTTLGPEDPLRQRHGLLLVAPVRHRDRGAGALALGAPDDAEGYGADDEAFVRAAAACLSSAAHGALLDRELRRTRQELSARVFQLHNLFDASRELTGSVGEEAIHGLVVTMAMGHFLVSRCALELIEPRGLTRVHARGLRGEAGEPIPPAEASRALAELAGPTDVAEMPDGPLRRRLRAARLALAIPLADDDRVLGLLAVGPRASGAPFSPQDRAFAGSLGRQALASLESARLHRLREDKRRQDRELQVARGIQRSLFPTEAPEIPGFEIAGESRPCYEVGGDSYDWIRLEDGRLALVVADVSGKGTPASLLMASVHASVQALVGAAGSPARVVERLHRFLFANTQASRYVTLFYAELDAKSRRLVYVNAGHVPPHLVGRNGRSTRLGTGGPAPGLIENASYEESTIVLQPGDLLAMVTDGVTEAATADDREFGDERVADVLRAHPDESAASVLRALVRAVEEWAGPAGLGDDLTVLVLRAR